ncbi:MAG: hypothetical protein JEZ04_19910 [Spirochaetales bacterium]|nr:hypothetical protein [Spirochaetales bacterium]
MNYIEPVFDVFYLAAVISMGIIMIAAGKNNLIVRLFGIMAVVLGGGDSFHLIPRIYALLTTGLEANAAALGIGKLITSVTMTLFYLILYRIWEIRFDIKKAVGIRVFIGIFVIARIILNFMPQNMWTQFNAPANWGIYRNIPFALLGILIVYLILKKAIENNDSTFKKIGIAVIISFACYIPVVLWASSFGIIGILMIPKTIAYLWVVFIGFKEIRQKQLSCLIKAS